DKVATALRRDFDAIGIRYEQRAEMRYKGQRHSLRIPLTDSIEEESLRARFVNDYRRRYGAAVSDGAIEFIGLRVAGFAVTKLPDLRRLHRAGSAGNAAPRDYRDI